MIWSAQPYQWPDKFKCAACFTVDVDATSPYLWQHRTSVPDTLATLEHRRYGMRRGLARLVSMLDRINIKGTFFVPANVAVQYPELLPGLVERGHEIGLHGYYHELVSDISDQCFTEALESSLDVFLQQTGKKPDGFRSPAWEMTPHMLSELKRLGLWDSSLMGDDVPYTLEGVTEIPVRWDNDDAIFFKFLSAGDKSPRPDAQVIRQWRCDAQAQVRDGGLFMLTVHDWISGRASRVDELEQLFTPLIENSSVWVATCGELANWHQHHDTGLNIAVEQIVPINGREKTND